MPERADTVVIGAGQAGLATSYHLTRLGREHIVLERGELANTWRTECWDGFHLNTPRWTQALPGHEYDGPDPGAFSSLAETISYLDDYAAAIAAPVRAAAEARRLTVSNGAFRVEVDGDALDAASVVVATGAYQRADADGETGITDQTVDTLPSPAARLVCNPPVSGNDGGHDCNPRWLEEPGASLLGKVHAVDGHVVSIARDLDDSLRFGDEFLADLLNRVDELVAETAIDVPPAEASPAPPLPRVEPIERLDLREAGIGTILWANGFRPDFSWIELPLFDEHGWPVQQRGVTPVPGLYFVGLHWLYKRKSSLLFGVGEDAGHVAEQIAAST